MLSSLILIVTFSSFGHHHFHHSSSSSTYQPGLLTLSQIPNLKNINFVRNKFKWRDTKTGMKYCITCRVMVLGPKVQREEVDVATEEAINEEEKRDVGRSWCCIGSLLIEEIIGEMLS
ncbi:unnamed protein product [Vicia faba]|uniref:Transmembrane protein n=1 Tax=Vicia faba TaxID=3906 RepID=A0AAV1A6Y3_VICFA|nr:unnamed protein product [Vicia faba]